MRKKFIFLVMAVVIALMLAMPGPVFARSLFYADNPSTLVARGGLSTASDTLKKMVVGQCNVQTITISGDGSSAGDYVLIYDDDEADAANLKFEISVGVAEDTTSISLNDAEFGTGIFAVANSDLLFLTIGYTQ